jgi:repressor LexA
MLTPMKKLHPTQEKLLRLLIRYIDEPLTIRRLQDELGVSSTSVVAHHIEQLEKKGYLKRNPGNPQDYQILSEPERPVAYLNLYGLAQCGPNGSILDGNPIDRIAISTKLLSFPAAAAFMVRARGDSMEPAIQEDDYVIARKTSEERDSQAVVCVNDGQALIKILRIHGGIRILQSLNSSVPPFLAAEDFRVEGEVKGVIKPSF